MFLNMGFGGAFYMRPYAAICRKVRERLPMLELDHIAVACETLAAGQRAVEEALGVAMVPGGAHARFGTHNMLLGLEDGLYLEVIAIDPEGAPEQSPRWFDLDQFSGLPRLGNWICRSSDLAGDAAALPGSGAPVALSRGDLRWQMAVPASGVLPFNNCQPALMEWQGDAHPAQRLPASGVRLVALEVRHPEADALAARMAPYLADARVRYDIGEPSLIATFDTPHGRRELR